MACESAVIAVVMSTLLVLASADVYMHNPRGMNDRCDEKSNDRNNDNRLWNSNNNAAGGYSWCNEELTFYENTNLHIEWMAQHACGNGATNKDDPNNPEGVICQEVIQLGCEPTFKMFAWGAFPQEYDAYYLTHGQSVGTPCSDAYSMTPGCLENPSTTEDAFQNYGDTCTETRPLLTATCPGWNFTDIPMCNNLTLYTSLTQSTNGGNTNTFNSAECQCSTRKAVTYGYFEPENWYLSCQARQRNAGLFTANQNPNPNNGAQNTRQEPNSARYGYECTEERDYYPYFHPTPWIDIAILSSQANVNCSYYFSQSQNSNNKCACLVDSTLNDTWAKCWEQSTTNNGQTSPIQMNNLCPWYYNTQEGCVGAGYQWVCYGIWNWGNPACQLAYASTDNRLGNLNLRGDTYDDSSTRANLAFYDWMIPSGAVSTIYSSVNAFLTTMSLPTIEATDSVRCSLRIRYNISTYDTPWTFDKTDNTRIKTDPVIQYGTAVQTPSAASEASAGFSGSSSKYGPADDVTVSVPVRLAIDTAQYGRTFQDRSYVFKISQRSSLPASVDQSATIWNVNVRGKRGNIAQVRNCLEYDYVPNILNLNVGDWVFFQWCGSDYNNNGNSGEGRDGTDRNNVVAINTNNYGINVPLNATNSNNTNVFSTADLLALAWIGQQPSQCYDTVQSLTTQRASNEDPMSCHFLNGPRQPGVTYMPTGYFEYFAQVINGGTINFMNSRNNNFSNRSQKGTIIASGGLTAGQIAAAVVCSVVGAALIAGLAYGFYTKKISFGKFSSRV